MCFWRCSEWVLQFRTCDIRCLQFLANIKLEELLITVLKRSRDFSKPYNICRVKFQCYYPNVSSKLFWMFHWFYDMPYCLWYTIPAFLLNTQLEQLQSLFLSDHVTFVELFSFPKAFFTSVVENRSS